MSHFKNKMHVKIKYHQWANSFPTMPNIELDFYVDFGNFAHCHH
jgi:hypothetical protein